MMGPERMCFRGWTMTEENVSSGKGSPLGKDGLGRTCVPREKMRLGSGCDSKVEMGLGRR